MPFFSSIGYDWTKVIHDASMLLAIAFGLSCLAVLLVAIYRLKFHPLSRFPGPFLAKLSNLYPAYHSAKGDAHLQIWLAHQKYGPIVRFGSDKIVFNTATALNEIYRVKNVQKSKGYVAIRAAQGVSNTHTCVDKVEHRRKRKAVSQGFSEQAIRAFEPTMARHVNNLLAQIASWPRSSAQGGWTEPVNMTERCKYLALDVMGEFGFGQTFEVQTREENRFLVDAIRAASFIAGVYSQYPRLKDLNVGKLIRPKGAWTREKFAGLMKRLTEQRVAAGRDTHHDLFSFIMKAEDSKTGDKFSVADLWAESRLIMIAGSDTAATALSATLFYLSRYPDCTSRLTRVIRETFKSGREIRSGSKLSECHYLRACIDESMRMTPPVGMALWREVGDGGMMIDGEFIPAGVDVGVGLYCLHHNEAAFPEPFVFNPERWLENGEHGVKDEDFAKRQARMQAMFHPFSVGSRKCVAQSLAYAELSLTIAKLLWSFDLRRPSGSEHVHLDQVGAGKEGVVGPRGHVQEFQIEEQLTSAHDGPWLEWRLREGVDIEAEFAAATSPEQGET